MVLQVAEGGGEALAAGKEMFVDAQHGGAAQGVSFRELALQAVTKVSLPGGRSDGFASAHTTAVDAVEVLPENGLAVRLGSALTAQNAWQWLAELPSAVQA